ncbi:MAG TPA: long-chain fatty acid--CoA ligase [Candidatus Dormibacteraeota bacterium]|nr:long-chain fatty acid--CoA ligase [Candidatus Dormibacteraeota bacterium]
MTTSDAVTAAGARSLPDVLLPALRAELPVAICERPAPGEPFRALSSGELLRRIQRVALGLRSLGLRAGDRVAILSPNCVDWIAADLGAQFAGMVTVPIFATQAADQVGYILRHAEVRLLFLHDEAQRAHLVSSGIELPVTYVFQAEGETTLAALEAAGAAHAAEAPGDVEGLGQGISGDTLCTLIYTSGTTGDPKGVMLTHGNFASNVVDSFEMGMQGIGPGDPVLSVLPVAHIYERMITYGYLYWKCAIHVCHSVDELLPDLREVRPVMMTAVPRLFERMIAGIVGHARAQGGLQGKLVPWALSVGRKHARARLVEHRAPGLRLSAAYAVAHALVLHKIAVALGLDRLRFLVSGSAPLHLDTALVFAGFGVTILQGYGLTETSPVVTLNPLSTNRMGSVGRPIPHVEVSIAQDGEILVRGANVMRGYYRNDEANAEAFAGGWFHTGDIGRLDADGYLYVTDRKKELLKTSGGKYLSPARIETALKRSIYIAQVMVVGEGRPHPAALIAPDWKLVRERVGAPAERPVEALARDAQVLDLFAHEVRQRTRDLAPFEHILRFALLPRDLTVESGDLSPTLKIKRRVVEQRFADLIERMYAEPIREPA